MSKTNAIEDIEKNGITIIDSYPDYYTSFVDKNIEKYLFNETDSNSTGSSSLVKKYNIYVIFTDDDVEYKLSFDSYKTATKNTSILLGQFSPGVNVQLTYRRINTYTENIYYCSCYDKDVTYTLSLSNNSNSSINYSSSTSSNNYYLKTDLSGDNSTCSKSVVYSANTFTVNIISNTTWKIYNDSWIVTDLSSGSGDDENDTTEITVTLSENPYAYSRSGVIKIVSSKAGKTIKITVLQAKNPNAVSSSSSSGSSSGGSSSSGSSSSSSSSYHLDLSYYTGKPSHDAQSNYSTFKIFSNVSWKITVGENDFVTLLSDSTGSGNSSDYIYFSLTENTTGTWRIAKIYVESTNSAYNYKRTFTIKQSWEARDNADGEMSPDIESLIYDEYNVPNHSCIYCATDRTITITLNTTCAWKIIPDRYGYYTPGVTVSETSDTEPAVNKTITITIAKNTLQAISGFYIDLVYLYDEELKLDSLNYSVVPDEIPTGKTTYPLLYTTMNLGTWDSQSYSADAFSADFIITSKLNSWKLSSDYSGVTFSPSTGGRGKTIVRYSCDENTTGYSRTINIILESTDSRVKCQDSASFSQSATLQSSKSIYAYFEPKGLVLDYDEERKELKIYSSISNPSFWWGTYEYGYTGSFPGWRTYTVGKYPSHSNGMIFIEDNNGNRLSFIYTTYIKDWTGVKDTFYKLY